MRIQITEEQYKRLVESFVTLQEQRYDFDTATGRGSIGNNFRDKLNTKTDFTGEKTRKGLTKNDVIVLNRNLEELNHFIHTLKEKNKRLDNLQATPKYKLIMIDNEIEILKLEKKKSKVVKELTGEDTMDYSYDDKIQELLRDKMNISMMK